MKFLKQIAAKTIIEKKITAEKNGQSVLPEELEQFVLDHINNTAQLETIFPFFHNKANMKAKYFNLLIEGGEITPEAAKSLLEEKDSPFTPYQLFKLACTSLENAKLALNTAEILNKLASYDAKYVPDDKSNLDKTKTGFYIAELARVHSELMPIIIEQYGKLLDHETRECFKAKLRQIERTKNTSVDSENFQIPMSYRYRGGRE